MTESSRREKKLYKDPNDKMIVGVASGVAKYFDIDTTLVRVVWAVLGLGGVGILLYVILWIVLEDEPEDVGSSSHAGETPGNDESTVAELDESGEPSETDKGETDGGEKLPETDEGETDGGEKFPETDEG